MEMTVEEIQAHIPGEVTADMAEFALANMPHYIFTSRRGKKQYAYCTRCHNEWESKYTLYHGSNHICQSCETACTVRASGRGRSKLVDELLFFWFLPSLVSNNCITAVGMYAARDYRFEYRNVKTAFMPRSLYVFDYGVGAAMVKRQVWHPRYFGEFTGMQCTQYARQKTVNIGIPRWQNRGYGYETWLYWLPWLIAEQSISPAVKGTPFERCGWEVMDKEALIEFFALAARYPSIEYLNKLGFAGVVQAKVNKEPTYGIRWSGKDIKGVLGISKADVREIRKNNVGVTPYLLKFIKQARKHEPGITFGEADKTIYKRAYDKDKLLEMLAYGSLSRCEQYIEAQLKRGYEQFNNSSNYVLRDYLDYIKECKQLDLNLEDTAIRWPHDLIRAHANTSAQVEHLKNPKLDTKCAKRAKQLQAEYTFEHEGLMIRPAESAGEIIAEGKILGHCVGGYTDRYADGKTIICFVRRTADPNEPYHTAEFQNDGRLVQCRGFKNQTKAEDKPAITAFLAAFAAHQAEAKQKRTKKQQRSSAA